MWTSLPSSLRTHVDRLIDGNGYAPADIIESEGPLTSTHLRAFELIELQIMSPLER